HWAALQTAAWVGMAIDYSRADGLGVGLMKTFDGKHPCCLCRMISTEKKSERKRELQKPQIRLEFLTAAEFPRLYPPRFCAVSSLTAPANTRSDRVPAPPPRLVLS